MLVYYILIFVLCLYGLKPVRDGFDAGYLSKERCNAIKGIFILTVFIGHAWGEIVKSGYAFESLVDVAGLHLYGQMNQLIVVMFLFYSGYGVMESVRLKGVAYVRDMPRRRILVTLLNFDVAVLVFVVAGLLLGARPDVGQVALSLVAWESMGNSVWYIFCILLCYLAAWVTFSLSLGRGDSLCAGACSRRLLLVLFVLMLAVSFFKTDCWYNTMLAFGAGAIYSAYRPRIEQFVQCRYGLCLLVLAAAFAALMLLRVEWHGLRFNALSIVFALLVVLVTMKVRIGNPVLCWLGSHLFPLYIYQRLPMMVLWGEKHDGGLFVRDHHTVWLLICLAVTLVIASLYRHWEIRPGALRRVSTAGRERHNE